MKILQLLLFLVISISLIHAESFSGRWDTYWNGGETMIELHIKGTQIIGGYPYDEGEITGTLSADGKKIVGKWVQLSNSGDFAFHLTDDGNHFTGEWWDGHGKNRSYAGFWNAKRTAKKQKARGEDWTATGNLQGVPASPKFIFVESNDTKKFLSPKSTCTVEWRKQWQLTIQVECDPRWKRWDQAKVVVKEGRIQILIATYRYNKPHIQNYISGTLTSTSQFAHLAHGSYELYVGDKHMGNIKVVDKKVEEKKAKKIEKKAK